jgi:hypothetical protein
MKLKLMTRPQFDDASDLEWLEPAMPGSRPFDLSELDKLPQPTEDDPPYHAWWVVDKL